jgi:fucose permease
MLGSMLAWRLVRATDSFRLATAAWALQAVPLWGILVSRSSVVAIVALALSGVANGVRVPPIAGLTLQRIPRRIRGETMTAASSLVVGAGCFALLAAVFARAAFRRAGV